MKEDSGYKMLCRLAFGHQGLSIVSALRQPSPGIRCWSVASAPLISLRAATELAASGLVSRRRHATTLPAGRVGLAAQQMASTANEMGAAAAPKDDGGTPAVKPLVIATHDGTFRTWLRRGVGVDSY